MLFFFYSESKKSVLTEKGRASGLSWKKKIYIIFFFLLSKFFPTRNLVGAVEHVNVIRSLLLSTWVAFLLLLVGFISSLRNCWWCRRRRSNSFLLGRIVRVTTWLWNNKREGGKKRETIGIGRWRANRLTRNLCEAIVGRCESFRHAYRHKGATHLVELSYARQAGRQAAGAELLRDALGPFIPLRVISWAVVSLSLSLRPRYTTDPPATVGFRKDDRRHIVCRCGGIIQPLPVYDFLFCHREREAKPLLFGHGIVSVQSSAFRRKAERDERIVGIAFDIQMSISAPFFVRTQEIDRRPAIQREREKKFNDLMDRCACAGCARASLVSRRRSLCVYPWLSFSLSLGNTTTKAQAFGCFRQSQGLKGIKKEERSCCSHHAIRELPGAAREWEREREREVNYLIDVFKWKRKKKERGEREREREPLYILHYNCNKYNDKCFNADLLSLGADDDDGSARRVMMTALRCRRWLDQTRPTCSSSYSLTSRFLTFFSFFLFFFTLFFTLDWLCGKVAMPTPPPVAAASSSLIFR